LESIERFLQKREVIILVALLIVVAGVNAIGLNWGLPGTWNPDELAAYVYTGATSTDLELTNFTYPSLTRYIYLFISQVITATHHSRTVYFLAVRFGNVLLAALVCWAAYGIAYQASKKRLTALVAALLTASCSTLAVNAHFAHNDIFVTLFTACAVFFSLRLLLTEKLRYWWLALVSVGFAAGSKYNGGIIVLVPVGVLVYVSLQHKTKGWLGRLFLNISGGALATIAAYVLGNHTVLTSPKIYFTGLFPALWRLANYGRTPDSQVGWFTQWGHLTNAYGVWLSIAIVAAVALTVVMVILSLARRGQADSASLSSRITLLGSAILLMLLIWISYNIQARYFLPLLPVATTLVALAFTQPLGGTNLPKVVTGVGWVALAALVVINSLRVTSATLLFINDARIEAGRFIAALPPGSTLEFTLYTPNIQDQGYFESVTYYEVREAKYMNEAAPQVSELVGEAGIEARKPDYFVTSNFLYDRFRNAYTCEKHAEECAFFKRLLAGETQYKQIGEFTYTLPPGLPQLRITFVNPTILVFQRQP